MENLPTPLRCTYRTPSGAKYVFKGKNCWERAEAFKRWVEGTA